MVCMNNLENVDEELPFFLLKKWHNLTNLNSCAFNVPTSSKMCSHLFSTCLEQNYIVWGSSQVH